MKKVVDLQNPPVCYDPGHHPPTHIALPPGVYDHECPLCKKVQRVYVGTKPRLS